MYSSYEDYERFFEECKKKFPKLRKKTVDQVLWENYMEKAEWYFHTEWCDVALHDIFYGNVDWEESEKSDDQTEEEEHGSDLQDAVWDIIRDCYDRQESVSNAAGLMYDFLKMQKAI